MGAVTLSSQQHISIMVEWNQFISPDIPHHRTCTDLSPGEEVAQDSESN
jgi:hypothetical protein